MLDVVISTRGPVLWLMAYVIAEWSIVRHCRAGASGFGVRQKMDLLAPVEPRLGKPVLQFSQQVLANSRNCCELLDIWLPDRDCQLITFRRLERQLNDGPVI